MVLKWQKSNTTSGFLAPPSPKLQRSRKTVNPSFSLHAAAPLAAPQEDAAVYRKKNRSNQSGAASDPRTDPGGVTTEPPPPTGPSARGWSWGGGGVGVEGAGAGQAVPGQVLGQVTAAAPTHL